MLSSTIKHTLANGRIDGAAHDYLFRISYPHTIRSMGGKNTWMQHWRLRSTLSEMDLTRHWTSNPSRSPRIILLMRLRAVGINYFVRFCSLPVGSYYRDWWCFPARGVEEPRPLRLTICSMVFIRTIHLETRKVIGLEQQTIAASTLWAGHALLLHDPHLVFVMYMTTDTI